MHNIRFVSLFLFAAEKGYKKGNVLRKNAPGFIEQQQEKGDLIWWEVCSVDMIFVLVS